MASLSHVFAGHRNDLPGWTVPLYPSAFEQPVREAIASAFRRRRTGSPSGAFSGSANWVRGGETEFNPGYGLAVQDRSALRTGRDLQVRHRRRCVWQSAGTVGCCVSGYVNCGTAGSRSADRRRGLRPSQTESPGTRLSSRRLASGHGVELDGGQWRWRKRHVDVARHAPSQRRHGKENRSRNAPTPLPCHQRRHSNDNL